MNRLLQKTVKQTPNPDAVTKYTYYTSGLLHDMQDPKLVADSSSYTYSYEYDTTGRKTKITYPPDSGGVQRTELWHYDVAGRNDTFTNRAGKVQTFTYDALNRPTNVSWNDSGVTPTVTFGYDVASRTTGITNANATITHAYFDDNLLKTETTTYADSTARTVSYTYNADADRATIQYPGTAYSFTYNYTGRNQLKTLVNNSGGGTVITYGYDPDGNLTARTPDNSTSSTCTYDVLDRVTNVSHALNGTTRTFDYDYDPVSNRKWTKRDGGNGDVFGYDKNDQVTATLLNVGNPDTTSVGAQTISYDANGNRTTFSPCGSTDTYTINNLSQYTARNSSSAAYDTNGNMTTGVDGSTYTYDSKNRLLTATKSSSTETFKYDGLNRQVSRTIGAASPVYNVYDAWNLIAEYQPTATTPLNAYLSGAGGLVKLLTSSSSFYYYQDASGCTSHLADNTGHLVEWYRYDLQGTPLFYNASNSQLSASSYGIRHLFTGEQWYYDVGLYDLRNRFYSPDIGRFLQADLSGFDGDPTNLYRYCGNNPLNRRDPTGLQDFYNNPSSYDYWNAQAITQYVHDNYYDGMSPGMIQVYDSTVSAYNASLPVLNSPEFRVVFGSIELSHAIDLFGAAIVLSEQPYLGATLAALGAFEFHSGVENWTKGVNGEGYELQPGSFYVPSYLDFSSGLNTYDAGGGITWVYDSNWNWIGEADNSSRPYISHDVSFNGGVANYMTWGGGSNFQRFAHPPMER